MQGERLDPIVPFIQGRLGFVEKIIQGRNLLFVTAYYILWAFVAWKWPLRIANNL